MKFLVSPQGFSEALKDRISDVTRAAARFEKHALNLRNLRSDDTIKLQHWMAYKLHKTSEDVAIVRARCEVLENLANFLQRSHDEVMERGARRQRRLEAGSHKDTEGAQKLRNDLLQDLAYEKRLINDDCQDILDIRKGFGTRLDTDRIISAQSSSQLQAWLSINDSSLLLVEGGCSTSSNSEISYVAAQVVESVLELSKNSSTVPIMPLAFFCSQHRNRRRDVYGRPQGLAKALLSQLIDQFTGLSSEELQACQNNLDTDDIESICKVFRRIMKKLPSNWIVVLVLEGIDIMMEDKTRDQLRYITQSLVRTHGGKHAATLKFLFTCTTSSRPIDDLFQEWDVLRIPRVLSSPGSYRGLLWKDSGNLGSLGGID
ncbi:hypothetical protein Hte_005603 [Hypoxylon texense]